MDLWIRSQDREQLVKVSFIEMSVVEHTEFNASVSTKSFCLSGGDSEFWCLGSYNTKERALEVLDEIQRILVYGLIDTQSARANGSISLTSPNCIVYEMPKE